MRISSGSTWGTRSRSGNCNRALQESETARGIPGSPGCSACTTPPPLVHEYNCHCLRQGRYPPEDEFEPDKWQRLSKLVERREKFPKQVGQDEDPAPEPKCPVRPSLSPRRRCRTVQKRVCDYPIYSDSRKSIIGRVFGSPICILRERENGMPVLQAYSRSGAGTGTIGRYAIDGKRYQEIFSAATAGEADESVVRAVSKAPFLGR